MEWRLLLLQDMQLYLQPLATACQKLNNTLTADFQYITSRMPKRTVTFYYTLCLKSKFTLVFL